MHELFQPNQAYWDALRSQEALLFERGKQTAEVMYTYSGSIEVWSTGFTSMPEVDTVIYSAHTGVLLKRDRTISLIACRFGNINGVDISRLYDIDLRANRESLETQSVYMPITYSGVSFGAMSKLSQQRRAAKKLGLRAPNAEDYSFVAEQLERGVSGVYARPRPQPRETDI